MFHLEKNTEDTANIGLHSSATRSAICKGKIEIITCGVPAEASRKRRWPSQDPAVLGVGLQQEEAAHKKHTIIAFKTNAIKLTGSKHIIHKKVCEWGLCRTQWEERVVAARNI